MVINIHPSREKILGSELQKDYFLDIQENLEEIKTSGATIFPKTENIFAAYNMTPFDDVSVVILGQDPYHGEGQAHGLSFSVPDGVKIPPSLRNIFKEIQSDCGGEMPDSGNLTYLAKQWVFLLNSILTVTAHQGASHRKIWREQFTDATISALSTHHSWLVFMLRWSFAKSKTSLINQQKHVILQAPHPSPLSAYTWFTWCKHFSQANQWLADHGKTPLDRLANK